MSTKFKYGARVIAILITACMIFASVPPITADAASMLDRSYVDSMTVGNNAGDSVTITKIAPDVFHVQCTHSLEYTSMDVRLVKYDPATKKSVKYTGTEYVRYGMEAGGSWETYLYCEGVPNGDYRLIVYKQDAQDYAMQYRPYVDRIAVEVKNGDAKLIDYSAIRSQNSSVRAKGSTSSYKDKALTDFNYMLFNKAGTTTKRTIDSSTESAYYKKISDQIVSSGDSDYTKLRKLYAYVAENLYYDNYKTSKPYDDPYYNLKHINTTSGTNNYNWSNGKVAAQCDGYAGLFIALARSQGIPARMVGGNLLSSAKETWESVGTVKDKTHCWVQAYADGRWIEIDPCRATLSTRNSDGSWTKARQINYMFFDMNDVQMAHTHCSVEFEGTKSSSSTTAKVTKPSKVTNVKLKAAKKKMTVSWKKNTKAAGYQIAYTTDKKFKKNIKYSTVTSNKTIKKTISKLKSKKYYYVKVRAYKKSGSSKVYGTYSTMKKIKVK